MVMPLVRFATNFCLFCFWLFWVSLRVQGSAYRPVFTTSLRNLAVSLVTGRLTNSTTQHLYTGPNYRVSWPVRKENDLQGCRSGNWTRATQLELTLFRAPYPLDQRSFPQKNLQYLSWNLSQSFYLLFGGKHSWQPWPAWKTRQAWLKNLTWPRPG